MCLATIVLTVFICIIIIQPFIICAQGDEVFCCIVWVNGYPATLNCHLAAFCTVHAEFKKRPNDNLTTYICEAIITLVYYIAS